MAWSTTGNSASGLFGTSLAQSMSGVTGAVIKWGGGGFGGGSSTGAGPDGFKVALYGNGPTPNAYDTPGKCAYAGLLGQWVVANEITGTNWGATGQSLTGVGLSASATPMAWTAGPVSVANTTITGIYGCLIYDHSTSNPNDVACVYIYFSGNPPYQTNAGTFGITWSGSGIWTWAGPTNGGP